MKRLIIFSICIISICITIGAVVATIVFPDQNWDAAFLISGGAAVIVGVFGHEESEYSNLW